MLLYTGKSGKPSIVTSYHKFSATNVVTFQGCSGNFIEISIVSTSS